MAETSELSDGQTAPAGSGQARIVRPERVPARSVWPSEAADFTPWLGGNLGFLDDLGLGQLSLLRVEAQLPGLGRSLDILAETADGRRVAIENQYSAVDHDHLTRGLAYAVGHDARALVVVAEEHRPEFIAVADYLNHCQEALGDEHGIAVFLVALSVERIRDVYVPRFAVLSQPNTWRAAVAASESGRLADAEDFVRHCDQGIRPAAEQILRLWQELPGASMRFGKTSVSLNLRNPFKASDGSTSVLLLYTGGQLILNRGYLIDGGMAPEAVLASFDEQIRTLFPSGRWGEKGYYVTVPPPPDPDAVRTFAHSLQQQITNLTTPSEQSGGPETT
jgi:hypothetical protein